MRKLDSNHPPADRIEELLRVTGRRPAVPAERTERVRAKVRAHWRAEVGGPTRGSRALTAAVLATAAVAAVIALVVLAPWRGEPVARIEAVAGSLQSTPAPGDRVEPGTELATGRDGRLALRAASGHSIRLDSDTRLTIVAAGVLTLERGAVYLDSGAARDPGATSFEVRTPLGRVVERGTRFEARLERNSLVVRVREGAVLLERSDERHEVGAGIEITVEQNGRLERREVSPVGAAWAWAEAIAPMMEIEGRPLGEFLEWLAREKVLDLEMEAGLEDAGDEIRLSGSIAGMTLEQALDSVLPTCGLTYRIEGSTLFVERAGRS